MKVYPQLAEQEFKDILGHLSKHRTKPRKQRFGLERIARKEEHISRASYRDPRLYYLLLRFARAHVPIEFTTIDFWENQPIEFKTEKCFHEESIVIGFGNFSGYEIQLKNSAELGIPNFQPILLNSAETEIQRDGTGTCYFLHFRKLRDCQKRLSDFDAVVYMGEWCIAWYRNGEPTVFLNKKNGLPKAKTHKNSPTGTMPRSAPTTAQQFLFSILESNSRDVYECSLDRASTNLDAREGSSDSESSSS
jgi:hypothetical protein